MLDSGGATAAFVGGRVDSFHTNSSLHHSYDPQTDRWEFRTPLPTPRSGHGCVLYRGKVFVMGGGELYAQALPYADVLRADVGHILETLKSVGRQHAIVVGDEIGKADPLGRFAHRGPHGDDRGEKREHPPPSNAPATVPE